MELGQLLSSTVYPEVVEICQQLIKHNNTLSFSVVEVIAETNTKGSEGFQKCLKYIFSQNLFLVDQGSGTVSFQNRATANFKTSPHSELGTDIDFFSQRLFLEE
eukprot:TRINITY_DN687_c0_g1_i1.p2 TRINITY_DN687_c0_g1~~TRINITY_DN687_c0_g1_i1.p2  ORF type:complete len:104 (-),score=20.14 TRINITY_DN687_c0_g1_i1:431-742(-)